MVEQRIIEAAARLASGQPELWGLFVAALEARAIEANEHLVASSPNDLQINQGRAQAYSLIFKTCRDAVKKQEEIERRQQNG
jgi:hypothetical protein